MWSRTGMMSFPSLWHSTAALLVYDLLCKDSFDRVQSWVKELRKMAPNNIVLAIAGNKSDMDKMQHVNVGDTERFVPCFSMFLWWVQTYVLTKLVWINCCIFLEYHFCMSSSSVDFMSPLPHGPGKCLANAPGLSIWLEDKHLEVVYNQVMKCDFMGVHDDVQICREHRSNSFCDFSKAQHWD